MDGRTERARAEGAARRTLARPLARALALAGACAILAWTVAHDPVAATYAREVAALQSRSAMAGAAASLSLRLLNRATAPGARVLVNGRPVAAFDSGEVHIEVAPGDRVLVDARAAEGRLLVLVAGEGSAAAPRVVAVRRAAVPISWAQVP